MHTLRVTLVVDGAEHAVEAEFVDRAGLMMMMKSLAVSAERGFVELQEQQRWERIKRLRRIALAQER